MDNDKTSQQKPALSYKNLPHVMVNSFHRLRTGSERFIEAITTIISSVVNFFVAIFEAISVAYTQVRIMIVFMVDWVRQMCYYDFKQSMMRVITLPKRFYTNCEKETRKHVWTPISQAFSRKVNRISRALKAKLRDSEVYLWGFCELCRRLFLLTSDYTPGGKYTVVAVLAIIAIIFFLKILTVIRFLFQLLELTYSIAAFLLHPLLLTLHDVLLLCDPLLQIVTSLLRIVIYAVFAIFRAVGIFIWLNLVSIASGLYRCWQIFINSTVVKLLWSLFTKMLYAFLEYFIFVIVPILSKATYYFAEFSFDISSVGYTWCYPWLIRGYMEEQVKGEQIYFFTPTGVGSSMFIFLAFLIAYRYRNRLTGTLFSEIDGKQCVIRSLAASKEDRNKRDNQRERRSTSRNTTSYEGSRRKMTNDEMSLRNRGKAKKDDSTEHTSENVTEGHIHQNSQAHICADYITGTCQQRSKCDGHHCSLPYHWQYRMSLEGWRSFSEEDNRKIEEFFCDPANDTITSTEIDIVVKSYRETYRSQIKDTVKLDFESMKIQKSYHRADMRRLTTDSCINQQGNSLGTHWLWYRKEENGDWVKYGRENDSDAKQEDLETAFLRKDGNYNFTRNGQEFRLQFFMNPMCEKSFRPYSKKIVRRRPEFRSPDDIRKLTKGNEVPKHSWFSLRRVFWWR